MKSGMFVRGVFLVTGLLMFLAAAGDASAAKFFFRSHAYSFQALRTLSSVAGGGADVSECLRAIHRIKEGDDNSWYREWFALAEQRERTAEKFLSGGQKLSAKKEYFRASNYYRAAEFFLRSNTSDPRLLKSYRKSRDCFIKGAKLSAAPIQPVEIPFEGTTLPGYLCLVDSSVVKQPLLIIQTGFDGTAEELYFQVAHAALERGYNCLLFEGPGQGRVIREQKLPFRHNWETVLTPVVDFAVKQKETDADRMAVMGISFGGYLAPRAVAFEPRIKALIVNGGVYDFHSVVMKKNVTEAMLDDPVQAGFVDNYVRELMKKDSMTRWAIGNGMYTFGAKSPTGWMKMTRPYKLKSVIGKIKCPVLVVDSEKDADMPGQSKQFFKALNTPKEYLLFTADDAAEEHCQTGALAISNEKILDWLDKQFSNDGKR